VAELVLQARTLPEPLFRLIPTKEVKVCADTNGEFRIIPINKPKKNLTSNCPFLGMYADKITVDGFLERNRKDKELET
jgi:hypothetical protein